MSKNIHFIILHGWAIDPNMRAKWQPFLDALKKQKTKTYFLPLPGLAKDLPKPWGLNDYANWLDQEIKKINKKINKNDKLVLLGHSFGGQISIRYLAQTSKTPVEQLILVASSGLRNHDSWSEFKRLSLKKIAKLGKTIIPPDKKAGLLLKKMLYKVARERDYLQASPIQRQTMSKILEDEVWKDLPKIKTPTLIIWGEKDTVTPFKLAKTFQEKIKDSVLVTISYARHSPVYTHVKSVSEIIKNFTT